MPLYPYRTWSCVLAFTTAGVLFANAALAHFQMVIPDDDMVSQTESKTLQLDLRFWHPMEGHGMNMVLPQQFGVLVDGQKIDLLTTLQTDKSEDHNGEKRDIFTAPYTIKRPGDHLFYVEPQPYWEPAEESFIVHYTKVIVNSLGMEEGWEVEVGLKTEIIPLTRPYGLWAGNLFQGVVHVDGKPAPFTKVEVEYYNQAG
ncbi:MAG: hypothetical protein FD130_594, partial [Halothiobacillaceae bacterium]